MVGKLNDEKSEKFKAMVAFYLEKTKKIYKTQTARIFSEREREKVKEERGRGGVVGGGGVAEEGQRSEKNKSASRKQKILVERFLE